MRERVEGSVLVGLRVYRWFGWLWMATVLILARLRLERPAVAVILVAAAFAITVTASVVGRTRPALQSSPRFVLPELAIGAALLLADGFVYVRGHVFSNHQQLGVAWPIAGVLAAGIAFGGPAGAVAGVVLGAARAISAILNTTGPGAGEVAFLGPLTPAQTLSLVSTTVLYSLAGGVGGSLVERLRRAEDQIAAARAREDVARRLHDGVLQTLTIVERRTQDPQLARLARDQEQDLRAFLFGTTGARVIGRGALGDALRAAGRRYETTFGGRVEVLVPDDLPVLAPATVEALAGAVGEAMTNAGKHGGADHVVIYVEPEDGGLFCSVKDDGRGFDPAPATERVGLSSSIRGRIAEVGGQVEVDAARGRGAEIRLHVPT